MRGGRKSLLLDFHPDKDSEDSENSEEIEDDDISAPSGCCRYNIKASGSYPNIEDLKVTNCDEYKELLASAFELVLGVIEHKIKDIKINSADSADKYSFPFKSEMDEIKIMGFTNIINILREEFADLGI
ncbi:MAG: hypothetical protein LUC97_07670 [Clostridiales bacterium]|nr:hypothetical protein [Clostridiales bacterium]